MLRQVDIIQIRFHDGDGILFRMLDEMDEVRLICRRGIIDAEAELGVFGRLGSRRNEDIFVFAGDIHMSVCKDRSLDHLTGDVGIEDKCVMGIDVQVKAVVFESVMANSTVYLHGISVSVGQMDVREADGSGIHQNGVTFYRITHVIPRNSKRRMVRFGLQQHINVSVLFLRDVSHHDSSGTFTVQAVDDRMGPMVNKIQRHMIRHHIEFPVTGCEVGFTVQGNDASVGSIHIGMET